MWSIWHWIDTNAALLSAAGTLVMAAIWLVYLHLFYRDRRRQQRSRLVIQPPPAASLDSPCLLGNMSREAIFVECVLAVVRREAQSQTYQVTGLREQDGLDGPATEIPSQLREGPLGAGQAISLGTFRQMLQSPAMPHLERPDGGSLLADYELAGRVDAVEIRVVAIHGPTDEHVGACRLFKLEQTDQGVRVQPTSTLTEQLTSRQARRAALQWLEDRIHH